MRLTIDFHIHSQFSDGKHSIAQLVDHYGRAGFDAIAITDHVCTGDSFLGFSARLLNYTLTEKTWILYQKEIEKQKNRAWRDHRMLLLCGAEYSRNTFSAQRNAHVIAVDMPDFISPSLDEKDWLREAKKQNALTIAAHPLKLKDSSSQTYYLINNPDIFNDLIDVWEVANARTFWREMLKTSYSLIASSDLHMISQWPAWRTQIECAKDPEAIKQALRDPFAHREFVFIKDHVSEVKNRIPSHLGLGARPHLMLSP